jgi:hypothetical protein
MGALTSPLRKVVPTRCAGLGLKFADDSRSAKQCKICYGATVEERRDLLLCSPARVPVLVQAL